ncbi:MAG: hypothetical protein JWR63_2995 [Conexibacter sp.]|nr:hypothetical protein [Conexibacter sp.]
MAASNPYPPDVAVKNDRGRLAAAVQELAGDRVIGIVGALTVLVATGLSWYSQDVSVSAGGLVDDFATGFSLWHARDLAAWLLVAGAVVGVVALLLAPGEEWRGGMVAAVAGFGVVVYSLVATIDLPDLGSGAIVGNGASAAVGTSLDVGPFVALLGGALLLIGGLAASGDGAAVTQEDGR